MNYKTQVLKLLTLPKEYEMVNIINFPKRAKEGLIYPRVSTIRFNSPVLNDALAISEIEFQTLMDLSSYHEPPSMTMFAMNQGVSRRGMIKRISSMRAKGMVEKNQLRAAKKLLLLTQYLQESIRLNKGVLLMLLTNRNGYSKQEYVELFTTIRASFARNEYRPGASDLI